MNKILTNIFNPNGVNTQTLPRLERALINGNMAAAAFLINNGEIIDWNTPYLERLLIATIQSGDIEKAETALNKAGNINFLYSNKFSPLLNWAIEIDSTFEMIQLLIKYGANINEKDRYNQSPLDIANKMERTDIVSLLGESALSASDNRFPPQLCHSLIPDTFTRNFILSNTWPAVFSFILNAAIFTVHTAMIPTVIGAAGVVNYLLISLATITMTISLFFIFFKMLYYFPYTTIYQKIFLPTKN